MADRQTGERAVDGQTDERERGRRRQEGSRQTDERKGGRQTDRGMRDRQTDRREGNREADRQEAGRWTDGRMDKLQTGRRTSSSRQTDGRTDGHLVDSEADGLHVLPVAALAASVLLHEGQQEAAARLTATKIVPVVVHLLQADLELRVDPKRGCGESGER